MLTICNKYTHGVWVAIMYYRPNCSDGGNWAKKGWWRLNPGECKVVYGGSLRSLNRYYCYYAEADNGANWSGPYVRPVPPQAFDWCEWISNTQATNVGFRLLDINSYDNFTLNLTA
ncbi:DUF1036 domain-containing protein [Microcoleus vaginatus]|uniref:DUF1036 domain-containing protein n=1 Tax=Microcoleus vaginatus TaxID=119532 RepID=UPI001682269B|nr:DUF1036 domain-containing protein [Microcoleus sp. FACHB-DQ6]